MNFFGLTDAKFADQLFSADTSEGVTKTSLKNGSAIIQKPIPEKSKIDKVCAENNFAMHYEVLQEEFVNGKGEFTIACSLLDKLDSSYKKKNSKALLRTLGQGTSKKAATDEATGDMMRLIDEKMKSLKLTSKFRENSPERPSKKNVRKPNNRYR